MYEYDGLAESLKSIAWDEGRVVLQADLSGGDPWLLRSIPGTITTITDEWHVADHLGSTRAIVDLTNSGTVLERNEYLPFGTRIATATESAANRYRFGGKEEQCFDTRLSTIDLGLSDFGARYYDPYTCRWTTRDPLAGKYHSLSPYNYCAGNPVNLVDPVGNDWYSYTETIKDKNGTEYTSTVYKFTNAKSQEELNSLGISGKYLGEAVVLFDGSPDEKIGTDDTLLGPDAISASVTIYGINGEEDIMHYNGLSISSDPSKYPMIEPGDYYMFQQQMVHSKYKNGGYNYRIKTPKGNLNIPPVGGINKATGLSYISGAFMHRTNNDGKATGASAGCLVIDGRQWNNVDRQLGTSQKIYLKLTR